MVGEYGFLGWVGEVVLCSLTHSCKARLHLRLYCNVMT